MVYEIIYGPSKGKVKKEKDFFLRVDNSIWANDVLVVCCLYTIATPNDEP